MRVNASQIIWFTLTYPSGIFCRAANHGRDDPAHPAAHPAPCPNWANAQLLTQPRTARHLMMLALVKLRLENKENKWILDFADVRAVALIDLNNYYYSVHRTGFSPWGAWIGNVDQTYPGCYSKPQIYNLTTSEHTIHRVCWAKLCTLQAIALTPISLVHKVLVLGRKSNTSKVPVRNSWGPYYMDKPSPPTVAVIHPSSHYCSD